jgi:hypothetical protein
MPATLDSGSGLRILAGLAALVFLVLAGALIAALTVVLGGAAAATVASKGDPSAHATAGPSGARS